MFNGNNIYKRLIEEKETDFVGLNALKMNMKTPDTTTYLLRLLRVESYGFLKYQSEAVSCC